MSSETVPATAELVLRRRFIPSKKTLVVGAAALAAIAYVVVTKRGTIADHLESVNPTDLTD